MFEKIRDKILNDKKLTALEKEFTINEISKVYNFITICKDGINDIKHLFQEICIDIDNTDLIYSFQKALLAESFLSLQQYIYSMSRKSDNTIYFRPYIARLSLYLYADNILLKHYQLTNLNYKCTNDNIGKFIDKFKKEIKDILNFLDKEEMRLLEL